MEPVIAALQVIMEARVQRNVAEPVAGLTMHAIKRVEPVMQAVIQGTWGQCV